MQLRGYSRNTDSIILTDQGAPCKAGNPHPNQRDSAPTRAVVDIFCFWTARHSSDTIFIIGEDRNTHSPHFTVGDIQ